MQKAQEYIQKNKDRFLEELLDLLRIPSVSADPAYKKDVTKMANAVVRSHSSTGSGG